MRRIFESRYHFLPRCEYNRYATSRINRTKYARDFSIGVRRGETLSRSKNRRVASLDTCLDYFNKLHAGLPNVLSRIHHVITTSGDVISLNSRLESVAHRPCKIAVATGRRQVAKSRLSHESRGLLSGISRYTEGSECKFRINI